MSDSGQHSRRNSLRTLPPRASSRRLLALIAEAGDRLRVGEVRMMLRSPFVTSEVIESLLVNRKLLANNEVRSAIARHRRTPETIALRFVSGLFWRDLLEMTLDVRLSPAVRRVAERYLVERLKRLTVGEKIAVGRRASGVVLAHLLKDPSLRVVQALLTSPRLTETILLPMAASETTSPRALDLLARAPRWGSRYEIRLALSRNPQAPFRVIFEILPGLRHDDLVAVAEQAAHSWIVRHRAREVLSMRENRSQSTGSDSSVFDRPRAVPIKLSSQSGE